jgi:hypothetical protein
MDNNINIILNEQNNDIINSNNDVKIDDFLEFNDNNGNINFFYDDNNDNNNGNDNNNDNNNLSIYDFLLETDKLTKYNAIRAGYGEMLELYYDEHYLVNDLLRICDYYSLLKTIKSLKCKKQEIIDTIVMYEKDDNNKEIVERRHQLWSYIIELKNDKYMKQFIAF